MADLARGDWLDPTLGRITFTAWLPRWEASLIDLRDSSLERNLTVARVQLVPRFGGMQLARIARSDVQRMIAEDMEAGYSNSSVRRHVIVLRSVLDAALEDGRLRYNVADGVRLPPESARPMRFLQPDQVVTIATAIRPRFYATLVYVAAYVGMR
jgi:site-specific recombinase XerC